MPRLLRQWLRIVLIRPSKYDDDGYVIRHFRGVLPSNTLACLAGLTRDVAKRTILGSGVKIGLDIYDDTVQRIPIKRIVRSQRLPRARTIIGLVGVQSNQFPRAADLARKFRKAGLQVLIGGFHVTGTLALSESITAEIQALLDIGVTVVKGEVEDSWGDILMDAFRGELKPIYDFMDCKPDLCTRPVPLIQSNYLKRFITSNFGTIDCSRGCPFNCSFCSIINVQGKKMRFRSAGTLIESMRQNYKRHGINYYFFTDDNFARNPCWREVLNGLIRLRAEESIHIQFMMQVDTQSHRIPGFIDLASRAGCTQVFIGMESINPLNLKAAGKAQNKVQDYRELIAAWHKAKVATHVAYILGFPFDTPESIPKDIRSLQSDLGVEQASFFMLTPLPGSMDHVRAVQSGKPLNPDLNTYDSFHETTAHPNFAPGELFESYRKAWRDFYSFDYMKAVLSNANPENYWNIFRNFIWYKNSAMIEGGHPMLHGFFRLKSRTDRRPGVHVETRRKHLRRRLAEVRTQCSGWLALMLEMEELWLQTRIRSEAEIRLLAEIDRLRGEVNRRLSSAELRMALVRAKTQFPELHVPSQLTLALRDLNISLAGRITDSRSDLRSFWTKIRRHWRRRQLLFIPPHKVLLNAVRDLQLLALFARALARTGS